MLIKIVAMFRNLLISSFDATIRVKRAFQPTPSFARFCESRISSNLAQLKKFVLIMKAKLKYTEWRFCEVFYMIGYVNSVAFVLVFQLGLTARYYTGLL